MSDLAPVLQGFFTDRMITQKHASEHTIRSMIGDDPTVAAKLLFNISKMLSVRILKAS